MIVKGKNILLRLDGSAIAVATNAAIELTQEIVECTPMPDSDDDDGWRHYVPGGHGWSVSHDGLYTEASSAMLSEAAEDENLYEAEYVIEDDEDDELIVLAGAVQLSEVSVQATVRSLVKLLAKFVCDDFPTITT